MTDLEQPARVVTYVLRDTVPRKNPDFPVVQVTKSLRAPDQVVLRPGRGAGVKSERVSVLEEGTSSVFYTKKESLKEAISQTKRELSSLGFTIKSGKDIHRIYVIRYQPNAPGKLGDNWVYVGRTTKSRDERLSEHKKGIRSARRDSQFLTDRARDLEPDTTYYSAEDAENAEVAWGEHLRALGYLVRGPAGFDRKTGAPGAR